VLAPSSGAREPAVAPSPSLPRAANEHLIGNRFAPVSAPEARSLPFFYGLYLDFLSFPQKDDLKVTPLVKEDLDRFLHSLYNAMGYDKVTNISVPEELGDLKVESQE